MPTKMGKVPQAMMEAVDTVRVIKNIKVHTPKAKAVGMNAIAKKAPSDVATPFPPLKDNQTEKLCAKIAMAPSPMSTG